MWLRVLEVLETKKNRICSGSELVANKTITAMLEAAAEVVKRKTIDHTRQEIVKKQPRERRAVLHQTAHSQKAEMSFLTKRV